MPKNIYPFVSANLEIKHQSDLPFPYMDAGFLYGYGLFETVRIYKGEPLLIRNHITRLRRGTIILDIPFVIDQDRICEEVKKLVEENHVTDGVLNIYLTPGDRSMDPSQYDINNPFLLIVIRENVDYDTVKGVTLSVRQESFQRTRLDRFKSLSRVKTVLEKRLDFNVDDVLLYHGNGDVLETTFANVFFVRGNRLFTPKSPVVLPGVTREFLVNNQDRFGVEILMDNIMIDDLHAFDEIFLTNALRGVILVDQVKGYPMLSSRGVARDIQSKYFELLNIAAPNNVA